MQTPRIVSISELTTYIKGLLERERFLQNVWVRGEISNFKHHSSGHMYFTLKDEASCIKAVMFRSRATQVKFRPEHGTKVIARGYIGLYDRDGQYQLYVEEMQPDGMGAVHLALEQLKAKLQAEGLFAENRKKQIPMLPRAVGVATSTTGAAIRDIIKVTYRRFPTMHMVIAPCAVQGEQAPKEIARAIQLLNRVPGLEVIITGRGGGSREDLWAFNSEEVVRAIAESQVPVISAVGHETDITLADLAADLRAPTPSAAAELAVPSQGDLVLMLNELKVRLQRAALNSLRTRRREYELLAASPSLANPRYRLNQEIQYLDRLRSDLVQGITGYVQDKNAILKLFTEKLDALSPLKVLARGYSICQGPSGQPLTDAALVTEGEEVTVTLARGKLSCEVKGVN